jgi:hypothetical protein
MSEINGDTLIGDVFKLKAGADAVIRQHFGDGCFTCPAITTEPLSMACVMHGTDLDTLTAELNALPDGVTEVQIGPPQHQGGGLLSRLLGRKD